MLKSFYLNNTTFYLIGTAISAFAFGLLFEIFFILGFIILAIILVIITYETLLLYKHNPTVDFNRTLPKKLSNGDEVNIIVSFKNNLSRPLKVELIENLPYQLQIFKFIKEYNLLPDQNLITNYTIIPTTRGEYQWGSAVVMSKLFLWSLISRKEEFIFEKDKVDCYPSFLQFSNLSLKAQIENREHNEMLVRRIGQSLEFEQIKEYAAGDDYRHINWKASAKKGQLMLNQYQDERSQDIYCAIDTGRTMKMPFNKQTLLDYAINATLALSKAIITSKDKAGLISFSYNKCEFLPPKKEWQQFGKINESLFNLNTGFLESDFEYLYKFARINIKRRSMIVIFTNFDSENAMHRNFRYIKDIAQRHVVLIVFFENSEISKYISQEAENTKEVYEKAIGFEKNQKGSLISRELQKAGIYTVLTPPEKLSIQVIKKYIEIKKQQVI